MPKKQPILILLESHVDHIVAGSYESLISELLTKGYDTFCLELPKSIPMHMVVRGLKAEIEKVETSVLPKVVTAINKGISSNAMVHMAAFGPKLFYTSQELSSLTLETLVAFITLYIPEEKNSDALAIQLRSYRQHKISLQFLQSLAPKIKMVSIDLDQRDFANVHSSQHNSLREKHMVDRLLEQYRAGSKIVFKVGKMHAQGLSKLLREAKLLDQTIFINLSSPDAAEPYYGLEMQAFMDDPRNQIHKIRFESAANIDDQLKNIDSLITAFRISAKEELSKVDPMVQRLCAAAQKNKVPELDEILKANPAFNLDSSISGGFTALDYACKFNSKDAAEWLINKGCDLYNAGSPAQPKTRPIDRCNKDLKPILEKIYAQYKAEEQKKVVKGGAAADNISGNVRQKLKS